MPAQKATLRDWLFLPKVEPAEDYGFFGPDSVAWKVWSYPTGLTIGFQRAVVIEELDPALVASVNETQAIFDRPRTRYDRTLRYFAMVMFGDSRSTSKAADVLVKIHSKGVGVDPVTGKNYDANDPHSQLWIHLTAWHSILMAYEKYGPGRLSDDEEAQYWEECAIAAELQTCDPDDVPRTRAGIAEYFEQMRPQLIGSDIAKNAMKHLLRADVMLPPIPLVLRPFMWIVTAFLRRGTLATMPRWMRQMSGLPTGRLLDALCVPWLSAGFTLVSFSVRLQLILLRLISPMTLPVAAPMLMEVAPRNKEVLTPREAQERYGYALPSQAHLELRERQRNRVFGAHQAPSDEGIIESQPILGDIA
ncbi:oxygenase MpaB family protein [Smaragdicoccus niigatensis]|uniref:oxygenase MpaB family protein n=1 Tax=Smaragdicoccus niigatensis TaxID=359359 RepID=UPI000364A082|nr:oxygenase MpaB family protein [Smaragdicoccus niigatensis]